MKRVYIFLVTAMVSLSFGLTGCAEEDPAKPLDVDWSRTATVKGQILIQDGQELRYPDLTNEDFIVGIPYSCFKSGVGGMFTIPADKIIYQHGEFIITVPAGTGQTLVVILFSDITEWLESYGDYVVCKSENQRYITTVLPGQVSYLDNPIFFVPPIIMVR